MILIITEPAGSAEVFLAGWFLVTGLFLVDSLMREGEFIVNLCKVLHASIFFVLLMSFPTVLLADFPEVFFTVWFCTEWFPGSFPDVFFTGWFLTDFPDVFCTEWFLTVLHVDLFNVLHEELASILHVELIWTYTVERSLLCSITDGAREFLQRALGAVEPTLRHDKVPFPALPLVYGKLLSLL